eukprot:6596612-Pyramimonas_sp.AAC.1
MSSSGSGDFKSALKDLKLAKSDKPGGAPPTPLVPRFESTTFSDPKGGPVLMVVLDREAVALAREFFEDPELNSKFTSLSQTPCLRDCHPSDLRQLSRLLTVKTFDRGRVMARQGDHPGSIFLVTTGMVTVSYTRSAEEAGGAAAPPDPPVRVRYGKQRRPLSSNQRLLSAALTQDKYTSQAQGSGAEPIGARQADDKWAGLTNQNHQRKAQAHNVAVTVQGPGSLVGHEAALTECEEPCTVKASTLVSTYELSEKNLHRLKRECPSVVETLRKMLNSVTGASEVHQ